MIVMVMFACVVTVGGQKESTLPLHEALCHYTTRELKIAYLSECLQCHSPASPPQVQWYEEDYTGALKSLLRAYELEPTWVECKSKFDECHRFLQKLALMVRSKGQLNQRRLNALMAVWGSLGSHSVSC